MRKEQPKPNVVCSGDDRKQEEAAVDIPVFDKVRKLGGANLQARCKAKQVDGGKETEGSQG